MVSSLLMVGQRHSRETGEERLLRVRPLDAVAQLLAGFPHVGRRLMPRRRIVDCLVLLDAQLLPDLLQALVKLQVLEHAVLLDGLRNDGGPLVSAWVIAV